jgi:hypothetical protein
MLEIELGKNGKLRHISPRMMGVKSIFHAEDEPWTHRISRFVADEQEGYPGDRALGGCEDRFIFP